MNSSSLLESSSIPARIICLGSREPVVSTVKIYSSSTSVCVTTDIFAEFHLACSVPLPSLAYASSLIRCPGAKCAIGICSEVGFTTWSFDSSSAEVTIFILSAAS